MERRIDEIETLKRKYGQTIEEVLAYEAKARNRLGTVDGREEELERLREAVEKTQSSLKKAAKKLSKKRRAAAPNLAADIASHLDDLGFNQSIFEIEFADQDEPGPQGFETMEFVFGPKSGEPLKPLRIIASSGEMSRVMLAVKSALADQDSIPLMVFDEIDANVGGEIAGAVGKKMAFLGERHQVVAITHMPQVASLAHRHFLVTKKSRTTRPTPASKLLRAKSEPANSHACSEESAPKPWRWQRKWLGCRPSSETIQPCLVFDLTGLCARSNRVPQQCTPTTYRKGLNQGNLLTPRTPQPELPHAPGRRIRERSLLSRRAGSEISISRSG